MNQSFSIFLSITLFSCVTMASQEEPVRCPTSDSPSMEECWTAQENIVRSYSHVRGLKSLLSPDNWVDLLYYAGEIKPINQHTIDFVTEHRDTIFEAAWYFDIPAVAIAGALVTEHTLNYNPTTQGILNEDVRDRMLYNIGYNSSMGPGQIRVSRALKVEPYIRKMERRRKRMKEPTMVSYIHQAKGAIRTIAALIKQAEDIYLENGIDITGNPEILLTLYNLGAVEKLVKKSLERNSPPRYNYFGLYYLMKEAEIQEILGPAPEKWATQYTP